MPKKISVRKILIASVLGYFYFANACIGPLKIDAPTIFSGQPDNEELDSDTLFSSIDGVDCIPNLSAYETATLIDVIDGDSIRVAIQGTVYEVRYIGLNTPEYYSNQRLAAIEATQLNKELLALPNIFLFKDVSETDKYDRLLRYVIANGKFINLELIKSGRAQAKKYYPDISCQSTFDRANN